MISYKIPKSSKKPSPQELYHARKKREEQERIALLPPGFVNSGNTCFLNSVLQALLATRPLYDAVHSSDSLSPLLAGSSKGYNMPIGHVLLDVIRSAWEAQDRGVRGPAHSPRLLLHALARKHEQYLDFAQQDAHELFTLLLDATRMEEIDAIKAQQKEQEQQTAPSSSSVASSSRKKPSKPKRNRAREEAQRDDVPRPLSDILFGGELASILICQRCHRISRTSEPFHTLSLSIRPEDYHHERGRTRERLRNVAKKWLNLSGKQSDGESSNKGANGHGAENGDRPATALTPELRDGDKDIEILVTPTPSDDEKEINPERPVENRGDDSYVHVAPSDPLNGQNKKEEDIASDADEDNWTKIRRISLTAALTGRNWPQKEKRRHSASPAPSRPTSGVNTPDVMSPSLQASRSPTRQPPEIRLSPAVSEDAHSKLHHHVTRSKGRIDKSRSRSPQHHEENQRLAQQKEYRRRLLADVDGAHPSWFRPSGKLVSVEDCLKMFTSVEVLSKENMVGCRRCWKLVHGECDPNNFEDDSDSDDESSEGEEEESESDDDGQETPLKDAGVVAQRQELPHSLSTPSITMYNHENRSADGDSLLSLPEADSSLSASDSALEPQPLPESKGHKPSRGPPSPVNTSYRNEASASSPVLTARAPNSLFPRTTINPVGIKASPESTDTGSHDSLLPQSSNVSTADTSPAQSTENADTEASSVAGVYSSGNGSVKTVKRKQSKKPVILRPAYKRYLIGTPPKVLIIHLKRFQQQQLKPMMFMMSGLKKVEDYVEYPEVLDIAPFVAPSKEDCAMGGKARGKKGVEKCAYRLYAVVVHIGNMLGGHYVAYVAISTTEPTANGERLWAYISDTTVKIAPKEEVLKQKAYICMYEQI